MAEESRRRAPLETRKEEALASAWAAFPEADDIRPQVVADEVCAHIYRDGIGTLVHTGVFIEPNEWR